ncbi:protein of unknown function [Bradyrhizobium vignae]|uniref:Uncharacterized protein n=1 Tax=Bradyrhizobium vignae TaxID=1549949 RepID=A0A2U3Q4Z9_9BRAD|nr:protein of unknown function [Bradyrhizobium vignae]
MPGLGVELAIRKEPGVLVLYAVSEKDNPTNVKVFEIYRNSCRSDLGRPRSGEAAWHRGPSAAGKFE